MKKSKKKRSKKSKKSKKSLFILAKKEETVTCKWILKNQRKIL